MRSLSGEANPDADQRVFLRRVPWWQFEALLAMRGDTAGVRMTYLEGDLELMSPSRSHEMIKKQLARLIEAWADAKGLELVGIGSWSIRSAPTERGIEPGECYSIGPPGDRPDFAVEVAWTRGGLDKLEVYFGLGVREVWTWREGAIEVRSLRQAGYEAIPRSEILPDLDIELLAKLATHPSQPQAVRELRASLQRLQA